MFVNLTNIALPFLHKLDAETAHGLGLKALSLLPALAPCAEDARLNVNAFGLTFSNPLGLAAGMDKNALAPMQFLSAGFGFVEVGTLTPLAQSGNPKPRMFRLSEDEGVINRLGFNNEGHEAALARLQRTKGLIGVNIGANKDTQDRPADYVKGIEAFARVAKYFTINISSPNTPNLRDLQGAKALDELLRRVMAAHETHCPNTPIFLKIAPDLHLSDLDDIVRLSLEHNLSALIVSNTTIAREGLTGDSQNETGGLSGKPLFTFSTKMLAQTALRAEGRIKLIGVGGIDSPQSAIEKIRAGATLIQLYSSLVYKGLPLISEIRKGLLAHLETHKISLNDLVGQGIEEWCKK
jgi:dihydroorotate dehydrogenase